jgi:hypothetical protein
MSNKTTRIAADEIACRSDITELLPCNGDH